MQKSHLKVVINYKIEDQESDEHNYSLNPDHTHFILVDDENTHVDLLKFRVALEKRLQKPILNRKSKNRVEPNAKDDEKQAKEDPEDSSHDKIPIVALLIGGGIVSINLVLTKIYQGIPILVFKGTGHAPNLICGTYEDFADRSNFNYNLKTYIIIAFYLIFCVCF